MRTVVLVSVLVIILIAVGAAVLILPGQGGKQADAGAFRTPVADACILTDAQVAAYVTQSQHRNKSDSELSSTCNWTVPWADQMLDRRPKPTLTVELHTYRSEGEESGEQLAQNAMSESYNGTEQFKGFNGRVERIPGVAQDAFVISNPAEVFNDTTPVFGHTMYVRQSNLVMTVSYKIQLSNPSPAQAVSNSTREHSALLALGKLAQQSLPKGS